MPTWPTAAKRRITALEKQIEACNKARFEESESNHVERESLQKRLQDANAEYKVEFEKRIAWEKKAAELSCAEYRLLQALRKWFARHQETDIGKLADETSQLLSESR